MCDIDANSGYINKLPQMMINRDTYKYKFKLHNNLVVINKKLKGLVSFKCKNMKDINLYTLALNNYSCKNIIKIYIKTLDIRILLTIPGFTLHLIKSIFC